MEWSYQYCSIIGPDSSPRRTRVIWLAVLYVKEIYLYVEEEVIFRCYIMESSAIKRLEDKIDAISEFLEDVFLTKEEEELLEKADKIMAEGNLKDLHKVI